MNFVQAPALPNPAGPLPVEVGPHDATYGDWQNLARSVWEGRNPNQRWDEAVTRAYPPPPAPSLGGKAALWRDTLALSAAFSVAGLKSGARGTHPSGVGARGEVEILPTPDLPDHPFFTPGRTFACRFRHANGSFFDDAACTLRGAALKLADSDFESPFDLNLNSGVQGPLWSLESFLTFGKARRACKPEAGEFEPQAKLMDANPAYLVGWIESVRDNLASYADLSYHSGIAYAWTGRDGVLRACRFRLRRPDLTAEGGLPTPERQAKVWDMRRNSADDRPLDYLRQELRARLARAPLEYELQVAVRDFAPGDTTEVFQPNRPWTGVPWRPLARVRLTEAMSELETEGTRFTQAWQPEGLGIFDAPSPQDGRSIAWARCLVYDLSARARLMRARLPSPAHAYA